MCCFRDSVCITFFYYCTADCQLKSSYKWLLHARCCWEYMSQLVNAQSVLRDVTYMMMLDTRCMTDPDGASCFALNWSLLLETRLYHWLHPLTSCCCSRARQRLSWPHPLSPCGGGEGVSRERWPALNGEWLADRLSQGRQPLSTWRAWLSCHLCFIAPSHDGSGGVGDGREGKKNKSSVKLNGLLAVGRFSLELGRRAGEQTDSGDAAAWTQPPLLCAAPMSHCHPSRLILPRNVFQKEKKELKLSLVGLLQNGAEA